MTSNLPLIAAVLTMQLDSSRLAFSITYVHLYVRVLTHSPTLPLTHYLCLAVLVMFSKCLFPLRALRRDPRSSRLLAAAAPASARPVSSMASSESRSGSVSGLSLSLGLGPRSSRRYSHSQMRSQSSHVSDCDTIVAVCCVLYVCVLNLM